MGETFEQWINLIEAERDVSAQAVAARLGAAAVFGAVVALIHWLFRYRESSRPAGHGTTLIMLCVIVALVTYVIGNSAARAFGLVAVLGIVRFRTLVKDTRDTCFVILAVAIGLALGAGYVKVAAVAVPIIAAVCLVLWCVGLMTPTAGRGGRLRLKVANPAEAESAIREARRWLRASRLQASTTTKKNGTVDLTYTVHLAAGADPAAMVAAMNGAPGVQKVSWVAH